MTRGRHTTGSTGSFYRDLAMMVVGILLVGAAVFLLLYLFAGDPEPVAGGSTTSSSAAGSPSTSGNGATTTTQAATSTTQTTSSTSTTIPVRPPNEVRVVVLNSLGLAGAAGRMTQTLADAGYQTQQAGDFEPEQDPSRIWYREGFAAEANALLEYLPGAVVEPLPDLELEEGSDIVVVLGTGFEE